nr:hypothetical protein [uncultured Gellertiella sp.]
MKPFSLLLPARTSVSRFDEARELEGATKVKIAAPDETTAEALLARFFGDKIDYRPVSDYGKIFRPSTSAATLVSRVRSIQAMVGSITITGTIAIGLEGRPSHFFYVAREGDRERVFTVDGDHLKDRDIAARIQALF